MHCIYNFTLRGALLQNGHLFEKNSSIVFAEQTDLSGVRRFSVMDQNRFAIQYASLERRSYYEVLTANKSKKLFFDIDIARNESDIKASGELVINFLKFSTAILQKITGLVFSIDDWFLLNSSTNIKASYHAILNHSSLRFLNLNEMKKFVNYLIHQYENEVCSLDIRKDSGIKIIDLNVYKENQNMRIFLSTKLGRENVLNIDPRDVHILKLSNESEDDITTQVILASLITQNTTDTLIAEDLECFKAILCLGSDVRSEPVSKIETKINQLDKDPQLIKFIKDTFDAGIKYVNVKSRKLYILLEPPLVCPYLNRVHSKNNVYLSVDLETRSWTKFCHGSDCKNKICVSTLLDPEINMEFWKSS